MKRAGPNRHHGSAASELLCLHLRASRIDGWEPEFRFHPERRWRFDVAWPAHKLALEVDGGGYVNGRHSRGGGMASDAEKFSAAAILGWRVMRATPAQVRSGQALQWIEAALRPQADMPITGSQRPVGETSDAPRTATIRTRANAPQRGGYADRP